MTTTTTVRCSRSQLEVIRGRAATMSQNFSRDALGIDGELTIAVPVVGGAAAWRRADLAATSTGA